MGLNFTDSGFPKNIKSSNHLLRLLYKKHADIEFVPLHRNSEFGCSKLHSAMWILKNGGLITIDHGNTPNSNDTIFQIKLTAYGVERVHQNRIARLNTLILVATLLATIFFGILGIVYRSK